MPIVETSLMKSSPVLCLEFVNILIATSRFQGSHPLKTEPNPPWPSFSLKLLVMAMMSMYEYRVGTRVCWFLKNCSTISMDDIIWYNLEERKAHIASGANTHLPKTASTVK